MTREHKWREVGKRLKRARETALLTQPQVAEQVGVTSTMVSLWERGRSIPRADRLQRLADLYHVSPNQLLGEAEGSTPYQPAENSGQVSETASPYTLRRMDELSMSTVAIVGAVSAGGLVEAWQEDLGTLEVPSHILREAPRAFGLRVYGNSLASEWIYEGAVVVVDPDARFVEGKIYAVRVEGGEVAARRVFQAGPLLKLVTGDGAVDEYHRDRVNIIGRVRWSFREH